MASTDLDASGLANRIEELLDGIAASGGPAVAHSAEELVRVLMRFYGAGLEQVVAVTRAAAGDAVVHRLAADQLRAMWAAWEAAGLLRFVLSWSGSFVPRFMRSGKQLSTHAFGCRPIRWSRACWRCTTCTPCRSKSGWITP